MPKPQAKAGIGRIRAHMAEVSGSDLPPAAIRLDSNESAFGPSPHAIAAMQAAASGVARYLEAPERLLAPAIAERHRLDPARIAVGPGSDDLLARLARAYLGPGTELVRSANGYPKVPNYAYANDAQAVSAPDTAFRPSVDALLSAITRKTRIVYLANPENPAGTWLDMAELRRLHAGLPGDVLLVIDGAYEEYVDVPGAEPTARLVEAADNVVMTRTFSKLHGLAGARVGWLYGPPDVVETVRRVGMTFPVATPSLAAAVAALEDTDHDARVVSETQRLRGWLSAGLADLGCTVTPSQGNFVLARLPDCARDAAAVSATLRRQGISVRTFASPAFAACLRITVGPEPDLHRCLDALNGHLRAAAA
jgi:histidinol-phosphate aminotransferase